MASLKPLFFCFHIGSQIAHSQCPATKGKTKVLPVAHGSTPHGLASPACFSSHLSPCSLWAPSNTLGTGLLEHAGYTPAQSCPGHPPCLECSSPDAGLACFLTFFGSLLKCHLTGLQYLKASPDLKGRPLALILCIPLLAFPLMALIMI